MRERVNCCTLLEQIVDIKKDRQTDMNRLLGRSHKDRVRARASLEEDRQRDIVRLFDTLLDRDVN